MIKVLGILLTILSVNSIAQTTGMNINLDSFIEPLQFSSSISLLLAISSISIAPFFLISTTSFIRFAIVLGMIRSALGTQQSPPNPVIVSIALFMTCYVMTPTWVNVYENAIIPYQNKEITQDVALNNGIKPFRNFMLKYTRQSDLALFIEFSKVPEITNVEKIPIYILIPAFMISELKTAFQIGFMLFIPFIVIDLVVSNILLSLGMFMLSPVMISLPFKILLFVLVDGWNLIIRGLLNGFN